MTRCIGIIAAAGVGSRMQKNMPKQYLPLGKATVLHASIAAMLTDRRIDLLFVAISPDDTFIDQYDFSMFDDRLQIVRTGGFNRSDTVLNTLQHIQNEVSPTDWILVHDAARACLSSDILRHLIDQTIETAVGAIVAIPVSDTLKKVDDQKKINNTIDRRQLWQAQTPQMFRYQLLVDALKQGVTVTDEASAIEALGYQPNVVMGHVSNIKITYPDDLMLATLILHSQQSTERIT